MRPDDPELKELLTRFVPVRLTDFKGVDMNRFRFDYDLTFAALMMDAQGNTYARYGTRDGASATARMSLAGLKAAMREVLARHARARPMPPPARERLTAYDFPAFRKTKMAGQACYHCHYAHDAQFAQLRADGKFTKELLFLYPLPENLGLKLDVDRNNVVAAVLPGSPAEKARVLPGDVVLRLNETAVVTPADLQFALNAIPDPGTATLHLSRAGKDLPPLALTLPKGWRRTDISWRPSQGGIPPIIGIWEKPLSAGEKAAWGIPSDRMALQVNFLFPGERWVKTRGDLRMGDVLLGVNGEALPEMTPRQFHSYYRMKFNVGDTAILNVLRGKERIEVHVPCLDVQDE